ncbi:dTDP-4-dehydrorhamnose reductase [Moritella viscosa]|uniref:dTDP-4-dehydrorhamnose reductase n=1 Tax=Moritella viscosa TaxID=80854 RepID=A0ABY1HJA5_9GAMM|nr:dTDP-4-dehydrorhamnose reductase [Moritella viscosa]SGY96803.1 dTDP-4-dehydrorhamnose reductase [Moritella viscosa]SGZ09675.1 dTDP-4-dehydrorhamnose reductase [Moritella viscosa]SHO27354.1 dTDP-4-dehydrorhamnose reductase [Moritella viscosa]
MDRLLVTGLKGQIGQSIKARIDHQLWDVLLTDIDTLDITNAEQVSSLFLQFRPDVVINTAAYTQVDKAEKEVAIAEAVNAYGPYLLAKECQRIGALLIHFSTEYIFGGHDKVGYSETDKPAPLNVYGRTKLQGDQYVKSYLTNYIIIRTSWVFSEYQHNFVATMLSLNRNTDEIRIVNDQLGCPTYAGDLANLALDIAKDYTLETGRYQFGEYNFCGDRGVSWFDFACAIFEESDKYQPDGQHRNLKAVTSEEYASIAKRPKNGILNCHKISPIFKPSDWREKLQHVVKKSIA